MDVLAISLLNFTVAFSLGLFFWIAGIVAIWKITPQDELQLLRESNLPNAIAFGGKCLGLVIPIAFVAKNAVGPVDMAVWCVVAVGVQLLVNWALNVLLKGRQRADIEENKLGGSVFIAFIQVSVGFLNGACMTV